MMEQLPLFQTSWAVNEGFKNLQEKLDALVPFQGKVPQDICS